MTTNKSFQPLLKPKEAAYFLNISTSTLANWRAQKTHPLLYIKIGRRIRYNIKDITDFIGGKEPRGKKDIYVIQQYDMLEDAIYDVAYQNGKQVWKRKNRDNK